MRSALIISALLICDAFNVKQWQKIKYSSQSITLFIFWIIVIFFIMDIYEVIKK
jgi:hypothetical protein